MLALTSLWLPVLVGALLAFISSMIVWMLLPHHRSDYTSLPDEEGSLEVLGAQKLKPGLYNFPHCSDWNDMKKDEFKAKFEHGPVGFMTILPSGLPAMGGNMLKQFLYFLITGGIIAYAISLSVPAGAEYMQVFRLTLVISWLAYGFGSIPDSIWYGRPFSVQIKFLVDSLIYALVTAGVFAWLWPAAAA